MSGGEDSERAELAAWAERQAKTIGLRDAVALGAFLVLAGVSWARFTFLEARVNNLVAEESSMATVEQVATARHEVETDIATVNARLRRWIDRYEVDYNGAQSLIVRLAIAEERIRFLESELEEMEDLCRAP